MPALDVDDDLVARQVCGQCTAIAVGSLCAPPSLRRLRRVFGGVAFGGTLLRVLQDELQLFEVELLRTRTDSGGAADVGSAATASRSRLAVQAPPPAASAAGQPDRQAVPRDRSAQRNDDDARRRVAANDSSVITLSFASTCQLGPQIARCRPPFAPFEQRRQLPCRQRDRARTRHRPDELAALQPLVTQFGMQALRLPRSSLLL